MQKRDRIKKRIQIAAFSVLTVITLLFFAGEKLLPDGWYYTFVRVEHREPHYRYEENWLLMRRLSEEELAEAVQKYGHPEEYYR